MSTLGEALTTARRASGLTQDDLAEAAHITQAALSRYENDLRSPDDETLDALADVLGVTATLLRRAGRLRGAMAVDAHMRRRATAKATVWRHLEARLNMHRLHAHQLLEDINLRTEQNLPTFDPFETTAHDAARIVRMQWRMPVGSVRNLIRWMEAAGILIIEEDFQTPRVDGLSQWTEGQPIVLLNVKSPTDRKRLTLAHELGHLALHSFELADDVERDANAFAAEFLMPAEVIRPQLRGLTIGKLHDLKREWGVSMQALIERANHLGVIGARERTNLYKRFSSLGWRTVEPLSDQLPPERAELPQQVGAALAGRGLTDEEITRLAGYVNVDCDNPFLPVSWRLRAI